MEISYKPRTYFNAETEKEITLVGKELDGEWTPPPAGSQMPVSNEEYIANVRSALKLDLPNIVSQPEHEKIMVMVCGGASAQNYLEDIRAKSKDDRYDVFCSNMTHDWLIENNIIPHTEFIIDPKESKVNDVKTPRKDVRYLLGINCNPKVFEKFKGFNVWRLFAFSGLGDRMKDWQIAQAFFSKDEYTPLEGGTMAGLRAMTLANLLGYKTVEFYGFDSCYYQHDKDGYPVYYSYDKSRAENMMEAKTESGKTYMTTPVFASQARQFIKWKHRLEWMNFVIHGDSLTYEINKIDEEKNKPKGRLISDYMREMNKQEHQRNKNFGSGLCTDMGMSDHAGRMAVLAGQLVRNFGELTILDYGCGKKEFENRMPPIENVIISNYDPCLEGLDATPEPADIVVCIDVLEHVEPEFLNDVLDDLQRLTKKICYAAICTSESSKFYSDGQNQHLIKENHEWWYPRLKKRFDIIEMNVTKKHALFVMQAKDGNNGRAV